MKTKLAQYTLISERQFKYFVNLSDKMIVIFLKRIVDVEYSKYGHYFLFFVFLKNGVIYFE